MVQGKLTESLLNDSSGVDLGFPGWGGGHKTTEGRQTIILAFLPFGSTNGID